jgi:hypothetical protein
MTTSDRSTIRLRLLGGQYPAGEIPLSDLGAVAECGQRLASRLARAEESRGGPGRSPDRLAEAIRLMFTGIEAGSTQLLIAGPPRELQLDLGPMGEETVERVFLQLTDGLNAAASGSELPNGYDDLSRRALADWLDALAQTAPEVEVVCQVGGRDPLTVRLYPASARASVQEPPSSQAPPAISVEGVLYAVNLHTGRYRIEDDMGSAIDLVTSLFTNEQIAPLLGERVAASGSAVYDDTGRIKEVDATTIAPAPGIEGLDPSRFWRAVEMEELLKDSNPVESWDELLIPGLSVEEGDAFLRALGE